MTQAEKNRLYECIAICVYCVYLQVYIVQVLLNGSNGAFVVDDVVVIAKHVMIDVCVRIFCLKFQFIIVARTYTQTICGAQRAHTKHIHVHVQPFMK